MTTPTLSPSRPIALLGDHPDGERITHGNEEKPTSHEHPRAQAPAQRRRASVRRGAERPR